LTIIGMYETIEVSFMVLEYTKFLPDGYFGNIKALFRKMRVNTVDNVEKIVKKSTKNNSNHAIHYNNGNEWLYYDFKSFLKPHFQNLPGIQNINIFGLKEVNQEKYLLKKR
ncbi:13516_t:CDS:1, partial [Funneliformis mosseae]